MNPKLLLCLALVLSGVLFGCANTKTPSVAISDPEEKIQLPIKFAGYRELYTFMAQHTEHGSLSVEPVNADTIFMLAADSETETYAFGEPPKYLWVITPHFFNGGIYDGIRGAQGNGLYFVVRPLRPLAADFTNTDSGFELVGIASGNTLRFTSLDHKLRIVTTWHFSADEHPEAVYEWNGKFFEDVK